MSKNTLVLKVRGWYKFVMILVASPVLYWIVKYFEYLANNLEFYFFLTLFVPCLLFVFQMQIVLDRENLYQAVWSFSFNRLSYNQIEKIKVTKNTLTIYGGKKRITFNNFLFTNFQSAIDFLAPKIEEPEEIEITGKEKYVQEYFSVS